MSSSPKPDERSKVDKSAAAKSKFIQVTTARSTRLLPIQASVKRTKPSCYCGLVYRLDVGGPHVQSNSSWWR